MKTQTIVVPIDFAMGSRVGFEAGVRIAEMVGAKRLHLVHVIRDLTTWMRDVPSYSGTAILEAIASIQRSAEGRLEELNAPDVDVEITREVRLGVPAREIVAAAEACAATLIVIASGKHTALGRMLGSVAHTVVRAAPCPVLVLDEERTWRTPAQILAAIDLSPVSERVLERAMEMALFAHAEVRVLSVFDLRWIAPEWQRLAHLPLHDSDREAFAEEHEATVDSLIERVKPPLVHVSRVITRRAPPANAIVEEAKALGAELIVVGSSGHSAWERMFLGSTVTRVLGHAPCPVLVVPS